MNGAEERRQAAAGSSHDPESSFPRTALGIAGGVIVWALHFAAIYGLTGLACARGWDGIVPPAIALATAIAVIAEVMIIVAGWRHRELFAYWLSATLAGFGLIAIVYEAIPVLLVPICG